MQAGVSSSTLLPIPQNCFLGSALMSFQSAYRMKVSISRIKPPISEKGRLQMSDIDEAEYGEGKDDCERMQMGFDCVDNV